MPVKKNRNSSSWSYVIILLFIVLLGVSIILWMKCKQNARACGECGNVELPTCGSDCVCLTIINSDPSELFSAPVFRVYTDQIIEYSKLPRCFLVTNKGNRELFIAFSYAKTGLKGQIGLGFDQYATVFANPNPQYERDLITYSVQLYTYTDVNYWSFNWNNKQGVRIFVTCKSDNNTSLNTWSYKHGTNGIPDPYKLGNPSIGCYLSQSANTPTDLYKIYEYIPTEPVSGETVITGDTLPMFRIDQQTGGNLSKYGFLDGWRAGECFDTYLFGPIFVPLYENFKKYTYGIIRIPVPNVYVGPYCPLNERLDLNYFSLSTSYDPNLTPDVLKDRILPFWTVNGRMMKDQVSANGCAYVIWMPVDKIKEADFYEPDNPIPPLVRFELPTTDSEGNPSSPLVINAFVLSLSDYCWIFRYRVPDKDWDGNPDRAKCFETTASNRKILPVELNGWLPTIYGTSAGNFDEFLAHIKTKSGDLV